MAVNAPLDKLLTYASEHTFQVGQVVWVPLGKRKVTGVICQVLDGEDENKKKIISEFEVKKILEVHEDNIQIPSVYIDWSQWLAQYYHFPLGPLVNSLFPSLKRKSRKKAEEFKLVPEEKAKQLNAEQTRCVQDILKNKNFGVHLLHGVTGSGKTEVYLHLIHKVLEKKQKALVLVPEIALTPQLVQRFSSRFPGEVAVIHSHLTQRDRTNDWWRAFTGETSILIGARSALFCPMPNLGMIILDEEHESSFKQDEKLKYHARDAAIMLAKKMSIPVILGSATPSLETWFNATTGKFIYHEMRHRVSQRKMPEVHVVDMRSIKKEERERVSIKISETLPFWMSPFLFQNLKECLDRKEQSALFLNRRGIAQAVQCFDCGFLYECPNCEISLTLHATHHLVCHYCDYTAAFRETCPDCHSHKISPSGLGTELVEKDVQKLFPQARIARADRDEITHRDDLEDLITAMEKGEIDILVGTQMIAKGLDFPGLNLVGLVMADVGFHLPDFRASEKSFQLLTQVSGRAGRHSELPGQVIVQTLCPEHPSVLYSQANDYVGFVQKELEHRKELSYPPFGRLASFRVSGTRLDNVKKTAHLLRLRLDQLKNLRSQYENIFILGPSPSALPKLRNKYRFHLLIKAIDAQSLSHFCREALMDTQWVLAGTKVQIDVDPINMM